MTWLTPILAGVAAAVAIPTLILLYFLKLRRRSVDISTTLLWKKAIEDLQANAPFQKLRRNLLLFLQLLALIALLLALAQPMLESTTGGASKHVIMIDRSASMSATDGDADGATRLEAAKKQAIEFVSGLRDRGLFGTGTTDEAMVIAFDSAAEVRQQFTEDKAALRAAIEAIEATDAPTSLDQAMQLAKAHAPKRIMQDDQGGAADTTQIEIEGLYAGPPAEVHLWTDGRIPDANDVLPRTDDTVIFKVVGSDESANVGITALRAERAFDRPQDVSIFVGLQSTHTEDLTVDVELLIGGVAERVPLAKPVTIPGATTEGVGDAARTRPGTAGVVFEVERREGALVAVSLTPPSEFDDALPTDDAGRIVLPPARQLDVAVVTQDDWTLALALGGMPLASLTELTPDEYDTLLRQGRADRFDVVILDRHLPEGRLPPGRSVVLGAIPEPLVRTDTEPAPPAVFINWERDHPVLRALSLEPVQIMRPFRVSVPQDASADIIAETTEGPGVIELVTPESHAIVVAFETLETTWMLDVSYPVFLASAVTYVGGTGAESAQSLVPGSILADRLPTGATSVRMRTPDDERVSLVPAADGRVAFGPMRTAGVYRMSWEGSRTARDGRDGSRSVRLFASNLLDPPESDIKPATEIVLASTTVGATSAATEKINRRLWPWLVLAALAVVMLEWFIYNRKVYV